MAAKQVTVTFVFLVSFVGVTELGITKFEAKIGQENEASLCMFKKLNFKEVQWQPSFYPSCEQCLSYGWDGALFLLCDTGFCEQCFPRGDAEAGCHWPRETVAPGADKACEEEKLHWREAASWGTGDWQIGPDTNLGSRERLDFVVRSEHEWQGCTWLFWSVSFVILSLFHFVATAKNTAWSLDPENSR